MIEDEGMPVFEGPGAGNLFVEYNVVLPVQLSLDVRRSTYKSCRVQSDDG